MIVFRLIPDATAAAVLAPRPNISAAAPPTTRRLHLVHMRQHHREETREPVSGDHPAHYTARTSLASTPTRKAELNDTAVAATVVSHLRCRRIVVLRSIAAPPGTRST